jgi:hypothetical protein
MADTVAGEPGSQSGVAAAAEGGRGLVAGKQDEGALVVGVVDLKDIDSITAAAAPVAGPLPEGV